MTERQKTMGYLEARALADTDGIPIAEAALARMEVNR